MNITVVFNNNNIIDVSKYPKHSREGRKAKDRQKNEQIIAYYYRNPLLHLE